jgi:hypothetical protein
VGFNGAADAGTAGTIPADGTIQIAFDRLLYPATVTRQSFQLEDSAGNFPEPIVTYDPVARVVSLSSPGAEAGAQWLTPDLTYTVTIGVATDYTGGSGPRAIDGATLTGKVTLTFEASPVQVGAPTPTADRPVDFCNDVIPIFQMRCSGGLCHAAPLGPSNPAEGLVLETPLGVANTAIARVSQESNTGPMAGTPGNDQTSYFGVDMAIVAPGDPGASWLIYKGLRGTVRPIDQGLDAGVAACGSASAPTPALQLPSPQPALALPGSEQEILSQYILGNQMPYPLNLPASEGTPPQDFDTLPMTFDELERVRAWIAQGAHVEDCTACPAAR